MHILIDAMGGDRAPLEIVRGAAEAAAEFSVSLTLIGDEKAIYGAAKAAGVSLDGISIVHTPTVITMEDDPVSVVRSKKDSSMSIGLRMLTEEGDAFVSAGNTGALHAGAALIVRKIKGIHRPAIGTILPFARPVLLLDCGANPVASVADLMQWAAMGSIYMEKMYGIARPQVGLLNNGAEEHKGTPVMVEAHQALKASDLCFAGNVEARDIPFGRCDVLVTDGFTGNVTLKLIEGMGSFLFGELKTMYTTNMTTKFSFLPMKKHLVALKKRFDASEHGGAPLLGLQKPVIKAHGSSDARAVKNAIRQAMAIVNSHIGDEIAAFTEKSAEVSVQTEAHS